MDIIPTSFYDNMKRYWRRRRYQRLNGATNNKKKLKIMRLGGSHRRLWKIKPIPKMSLKIVSPIKLLVKFHDAYIDMMIRMTGNVTNSSNVAVFGGKRIPKGREGSMVSSYEEFDSRLVFEIYKRLLASGELAAVLSN